MLYQLVERHYPAFREMRAEAGRPLPDYIEQEFDAYLKCGRLDEGFLRVRCETCHAEKLVAFSHRKRGFCPSCAARRMAETAALLVDQVLPNARCGGMLRVIASIEEPEVIAKILAHLERTARDQFQPELPLGARAPPPARLL